jgi:DNA primase
MSLPDDFIYGLKQANPIDGVMSSYLQLIRRGRGYVCLCPFHTEKTPSCNVNADDGLFFCFGCQAGGDVITFIMKIENMEYMEAVRFLAERSRTPLPAGLGEGEETARSKARILEINRYAAKFFHEALTAGVQGEKGRRYLKDRSLTAETIKKYGLGYAPDDWRCLENFLKSKGFDEEELIAANVCVRGKNGGLYDRFRDRVIFPIIDLRGNVVAFGGRSVDGAEPKYLHSSDTLVFKKSRLLFSLNFAKKSSERRLILVEGYMDVIALDQAGFHNAVASLGTAFTKEQANLIRRCADEAVIAYDADEAGQSATQKAASLLSEAGVSVRVVGLSGAKDPDEYIKTFGNLRFKQLLEKSGGAVDFELKRCAEGLDLNSSADKASYLKRCANVLANISSPIEREVYLSRIAAENAVGKEALSAQVNGVIGKRVKSDDKRKEDDIVASATGRARGNRKHAAFYTKEEKAERGIIAYLADNPGDAGYLASKLSPADFPTDFHASVYERIISGAKKAGAFEITSLQSELSADEMGTLTEIVLNGAGANVGRTVIDDYIDVLRERGRDAVNAGELSDEEFKKQIEDMKNRKAF